MSQVSTSFDAGTYSQSNKPSVATLKTDIAALAAAQNDTDSGGNVNVATEKTPISADMVGIIDSADSNTLKKGSIANINANALREGQMQNGYFLPTVASNNLTVTLYHQDALGNLSTPSATKPVKVKIGGIVRTITSALARTWNAGSSYLNLGSAELATKTAGLFTKLVWNTNLSAVDLIVARIPFGDLISEYTDSLTGEKGYLYSGTKPASTDVCVNVGYFEATLSAGAGYTWSVPTFTASNLIQRPIYETRWLDFVSVLAGWSGTPTQIAQYKVMDNRVMVNFAITTGVSNDTIATGTLPFVNGDASNVITIPYRVADNSTIVTTPGSLQIDNNAKTFALRSNMATGAWTNTNNKLIYPTAPWTYKI